MKINEKVIIESMRELGEAAKISLEKFSDKELLEIYYHDEKITRQLFQDEKIIMQLFGKKPKKKPTRKQVLEVIRKEDK